MPEKKHFTFPQEKDRTVVSLFWGGFFSMDILQ